MNATIFPLNSAAMAKLRERLEVEEDIQANLKQMEKDMPKWDHEDLPEPPETSVDELVNFFENVEPADAPYLLGGPVDPECLDENVVHPHEVNVTLALDEVATIVRALNILRIANG